MAFLRAIMTAVLLAAVPFGASAQRWPTRAIVIVQGFPAGAGTDVYAAMLAEPLSKALGVKVLTEARSGAAGNRASEHVARAKPDGYTLLLGTAGTHAINPTLYGRLSFDVEKDFAPITLLGDVPNVLIVNPAVPVRSVKEFIAFANANPGKVNYGSTGNGTSGHLAGERFRAVTGVDIAHIPYGGTPPALTALMANEVQAMFQQSITVVEPIKAGVYRALGVTTRQRVSALPDVPTIEEAGVPGYESSTWYGLFAPANTPQAIIDRLHLEVVKIINTPEFGQDLRALGITPLSSNPVEFAAILKQDIARWAEVVKATGAKLD